MCKRNMAINMAIYRVIMAQTKPLFQFMNT